MGAGSGILCIALGTTSGAGALALAVFTRRATGMLWSLRRKPNDEAEGNAALLGMCAPGMMGCNAGENLVPMVSLGCVPQLTVTLLD